MFQAGFVINDQGFVLFTDPAQIFPQEIIDETVAVRPFLTAHRQQIQPRCFDQRFVDLAFDPLVFGDSRGFGFRFGAEFLAQIPDGPVDVQSEFVGKTAVRVCIDGQDGLDVSGLQTAAQQGGQGCLPGPSLTRQCNT